MCFKHSPGPYCRFLNSRHVFKWLLWPENVSKSETLNRGLLVECLQNPSEMYET